MPSSLLAWSSIVSIAVALTIPSQGGLLTEISPPSQGAAQKLVGSSFGVPGQPKPGNPQAYDYIIIGGGTAGLTVAERLGENPTLRIAVIEAGGFYEIDNGNISQIPALYYKDFNQTADPANIQPLIDWGYYTAPLTGLGNRVLHYAQGKTLGGSSARNSNIYTRPSVGFFQRLANHIGDQSWDWNGVTPYFQKSFKFTPPNTSKNGGNNITFDSNAFSPSGGPVHLTFANYYQPMNGGLIKAFNSLGFKSLQSLYSGTLLGFGYLGVTIDPTTQLKDSSETAFLGAALQNSSVTVYKSTFAQKIVFNGNTATGVQVETQGSLYTLTAAKEVIVSAGVTRSPQILQVSGIGPASMLQGLGIKVIKDSPVGQNWQDQCAFEFTYPMNVEGNAALDGGGQFLAQATQQFLTSQTGPLTNWGGDILGFEKLPQPYRNALNGSAQQDLSFLAADEPEIEWLTASHGPMGATSSFVTFTPAIAAPISKGTIKINSTDTKVNPIVDSGTLTAQTDQLLAIQIFRRLQGVVNASGLVSGPEMKAMIAPGASDDDVLKGLQQNGLPWYHGVASCPMGNSSDQQAVVDSHGRVYGAQNLRVVDASIIPFAAAGHSMSLAYMVAEKIADFIKNGQ